MVHCQIVLATYFDILEFFVAIGEEVESLDDRPIGRVLEGNHSVVGFLLLKSGKSISEGNMWKQFR